MRTILATIICIALLVFAAWMFLHVFFRVFYIVGAICIALFAFYLVLQLLKPSPPGDGG